MDKVGIMEVMEIEIFRAKIQTSQPNTTVITVKVTPFSASCNFLYF